MFAHELNNFLKYNQQNSELYRNSVLYRNIDQKQVVRWCSVEKVFLDISQNSQENTRARVLFWIKLQALGLIDPHVKSKIFNELRRAECIPSIFLPQKTKLS